MSRFPLFTSRRVKAAVLAAALVVGGVVLAPNRADAAADEPATELVLASVDSPVSQNASSTFTVTANDANGPNTGVDKEFDGTVTFSAAGAALANNYPACDNCFTITPNNGAGHEREYTFKDEEDGVKTFTIVWTNYGEDRTLAVTTTDLGEDPVVDSVDNIDIKNEAANHVEFDADGAGAVDTEPTINAADAVHVTLRNALGDIDKNYNLEVHFENSTCTNKFTVNPHVGDDPMNKHYVFAPADHGEKTFNVTWLGQKPAGPGCDLTITANRRDVAGQDSDTVDGIDPQLPIAQPTTSSSSSTSSSTTSTTVPPPAHEAVYVTGAMAGGAPHVLVRKQSDNSIVRSFYAYDPNFHGGVNVAFGDVNDDGYKDIVTAAGPGGGPHVKVFSGKDGSTLASFYAYNTGLANGVNVAVGDVNNDGKADVITGPNAQPGWGPHVKAFSGVLNSVNQPDTGYQAPTLVASFFAYDVNFTGGVRVASADLDGDNKADIVTGAGASGGPPVKGFKSDGVNGSPAIVANLNTFAFEANFTGGVFVAASEGGDGVVHVLVSSGPGRATEVKTLIKPENETGANFVVGSGNVGASVALGQLDNDPADEFALANASGSSTVRKYNFPSTIIGSPAEAYGGFPNGATIAIGVI